MDGRRRAHWALATALVGLVGCNTLSKNGGPAGPKLTQNSPPKPFYPGTDPSGVASAKAKSGPTEPIKASTLVSVGQYREQLAQKPGLSFADQEQIRSQARQAYEQALQVDPKYTPTYIALARSFEDVGDHVQSAEMLQKAVALAPNDAALWHEIGLMRARSKDWNAALECLQKSVQLDPNNRQHTRTYGLALARNGKFDDALAALRKSMKEEEAHFTLARMMEHVNQPAAAREQLQLSLKANPAYMPAREQLAHLNAGGQSPIRPVGYEQPQSPTVAPRVEPSGIE